MPPSSSSHPSRTPIVRRILCVLVLGLACALPSCGDDRGGDQYYGTDAANGYQGPDGGIVIDDERDASSSDGRSSTDGKSENSSPGDTRADSATPAVADSGNVADLASATADAANGT